MTIVLVLAMSWNLSSVVYADTVAEVVTPATTTAKSVNISKISTSAVTYGYSVTLTALSRGLDAKKCQYAFYYKYEDESWNTIKSYSTTSHVEWTPDQIGTYQLCIKILCNNKVYKKYFDITCSEELLNLSVLSSSHICKGDSVTVTAKADGGLKDYTFAYYCKRVSEDWWTTLNDFKEATSMQWKPAEAGEYDVCIKVKDSVGQISEKTFALTVSEEGVKTPAFYTLSLKAPIAAPYQWSCDISDENVIALSKKTTGSANLKDLSVGLLYTFQTVSAGTADITMNYTAYNGKQYHMVYTVTVDKNLNCTAAQTGSYFEEELPSLQRIETPFTLHVKEAPGGYTWKYDISAPNVTELTEESPNTYTFCAFRKGISTITLSCISLANAEVLYQLIYDISVDDTLTVSQDYFDGYYFEDAELPQIEL